MPEAGPRLKLIVAVRSRVFVCKLRHLRHANRGGCFHSAPLGLHTSEKYRRLSVHEPSAIPQYLLLTPLDSPPARPIGLLTGSPETLQVVSEPYGHTREMGDCPGCTQRKGDDGVWRSLGPHRAGCESLEADIEDRREVLSEMERRLAAHRMALEEGCGNECGHPIDDGSLADWRSYHEVSLRNDEALAEQVQAELWVLLADGAGRLDAPITDAENILRLPPGAEEEDYWRARHEAAHVVVGLALGRTLHHVTIEPDAGHHPDNRGSTVWLDDGPPPRNVDAVTTWAGVIAGPERSVVEGDIERLREIDGLYDNYRWGARRVYRALETTILAFAGELAQRRTMTGVEASAWFKKQTSFQTP